MGLYQVTPGPQGQQADRRDQPQPVLGHRQFAAAPRRRSRHSARRPHFLQRSDHPLSRCTNGRSMHWRAAATAASSVTIRATSSTAHGDSNLTVPERRLHSAGRPIHSLRRDLGLPRQALLVRRTQDGPAGDGHRESARLSRQHQSRFGRQLLAGDCRHALAGLGSGASHAGLPPPDGAARSRQDEWLYPNLNTGCVVKFDDKGDVLDCSVGSERRQSSHDHLDARAQGRLYLGGISNNRIGTLSDFPAPIPTGTASTIYWGQPDQMLRGMIDRFVGRGEAAITVPPMDGALRPNQLLEEAGDRASRRVRSTIWCFDAR